MSSDAAVALTVDQIFEQAIAHHQAGRLQVADRLYRSVLQLRPNHADANHNLGVLAVQARQPYAGLPHFKAALGVNPSENQYWQSYVEALIQCDQLSAALEALNEGLRHGLDASAAEVLIARLNAGQHVKAGARVHMQYDESPGPQESGPLVTLFMEKRYAETEGRARAMTARFPLHAFGWKLLGAVLEKTGRCAEALAPARRAVDLSAEDAEAHYNLGIIYRRLGDLTDAENSCRRALERRPDFSEAHGCLGTVLKGLGRLNEATASFQRAVELAPDSYGAQLNLGLAFQELHRLSDAEAAYRRSLKINPNFPDTHNMLGCVLSDQGHYAEAEANFRRALELMPNYSEACSNLGYVLHELGRFTEAEIMCRRALTLNPELHHAHNNLGNTLRILEQFEEAAASCRRAVELKPDFFQGYNNLGNALLHLGDLPGAQASYRQAIQIKPDSNDAYSNLLFCLSNDERVNASTLYAEHVSFGRQFEAPLQAGWPRHSNIPDPERELRIGFASGDLRDHALAYFIGPVLAHLSKNPNLSLHAFSNCAVEDHITQRLRKYFTHWHRVTGLSDASLADKIQTEGIDILIDLSGHTALNRLLTFARKPAPVQASWIGYPGTTGLSAMDYFLADRNFLPRELFEAQFTEKLVYLPAVVPFQPAAEAPAVNALPALKNGYVTFGSFNRQSKIGPLALEQWAKLLRALPGSRMLLGGLPHGSNYEGLIERFSDEGIVAERLSLYSRCGINDYLNLHRQVDLCLDTLAYTGGTTTLHALWMGVPTLTIAGETAPRRQGAAILADAGMEAFVAKDAEEFVHKGLQWAGNLRALARLRSGLRKRFAKSAVGQPTLVAAGLERALRVMWRRWCAGQPPEALDAS